MSNKLKEITYLTVKDLKKHDIINCTEQELIYTNWISEWPQNSPKINNT